MTLLIKNGRLLNPATNTDGLFDLYIEDGKIASIGKNLEMTAEKEIEAAGCFVMPGFIDLHVHLREPGQEQKETIETGGRAAARGGFTTICAMPNTRPVVDTGEKARFVMNKAKSVSPARVLQLGSVTLKQAGKVLADIAGMAQHGVAAVSEDGKSVMNVYLYKKAMEIAAQNGIAVFAHCEDKDLVHGGVINEGTKSKEYELPGISNLVENIIIARDILLAKETGVRLHLCHCSTKESVDLVRAAKEAGLPVSAEVCPHHFTLTDEDIPKNDTNYKMNPPLRTKEDVEALKEGLRTGVMDAVATDHAPHAGYEKYDSMLHAPFGIVGLETAASLTYTELVKEGYLTPLQMAERMSYSPAKILRMESIGNIQEGLPADIVVFNPDMEYIINPMNFYSKGRNTPFKGRRVTGCVVGTIVNGKIVYLQEGIL